MILKNNIAGLGTYMQKNQERVLLFVLFGIITLRFISLGAYALWDPTESRYAEIAREMVATKNWVTPQLDPGCPFWAKPPLSIWATAIFFKLFGVSDFTARISSFVFSLASLWLVYLLTYHLKGRLCALKATIILATTGMFYILMGGVMTDIAFSFAITMAMVSSLLTVLTVNGRQQCLWGYLFFFGVGLSVLAKGPLGFVLIGMPFCLWPFFCKERIKVWQSFPWITGMIVLAAIVLPWHIMAEYKTPGFLKYYVYGEHFQRFVVGGWKGDMYGKAHAQPKGMIWVFFIATTLPWLIVLVANVWRLITRKKLQAQQATPSWISYLILYAIAPVVFFTFAGNILWTYTLPCLPACAILTAYYIERNNTPDHLSHVPWFVRENIFTLLALLVPIVFFFAAFFVVPNIALSMSHKSIAESFMQLNNGSPARLIYTRKMPYSADFYTNGQAVDMAEELSVPEIRAYLRDTHNDCYVIYEQDKGLLPDDIWSSIKMVQDFGKYSLYQEV